MGTILIQTAIYLIAEDRAYLRNLACIQTQLILRFYCLGFIVLEVAMHTTRGEK